MQGHSKEEYRMCKISQHSNKKNVQYVKNGDVKLHEYELFSLHSSMCIHFKKLKLEFCLVNEWLETLDNGTS